MRATFETLETRRMMSSSLSGGVLTILGSAVADVINLSQANGKLRVTENGATRAFAAKKVKSIVVNALGGNDRIAADSTVQKPMVLRGGDGSDTLVGGAGSDVFEGGAGVDWVDYSSRSDNLNISLDDLANDGGAAEKDNVKSDVENIRTGRGNDFVRGSAAANVIETNDGNDTVYAADGNDLVRGGWGNDHLHGEAGADTIYGQTEILPLKLVTTKLNKKAVENYTSSVGNILLDPIKAVMQPDNDVISGGEGADTLHGQGGNDTISGGDSRDSIFGNEGADSISGGLGDDVIDAGAGDDVVWGNVDPVAAMLVTKLDSKLTTSVTKLSKATKLVGAGAIGSKLSASLATSVSSVVKSSPITGSVSKADKRFDTIDVIAKVLNPTPTDADVILGGAGNDSLHGNEDGDTISGGDGADKLWGDEGDDVLRGNNHNDSLYGGAGADNLGGDGGDDLLVAIGGGASDRLSGGAGSDQFWQDDASTETSDADLGEILFGSVHKVARFANGVSKELNGQNFADPNPFDFGQNRTSAADDFTPVFNNFRSNPLFGANGPRETDIRQGSVGDCYFLSVLAGAARSVPFRITKGIVDLGDGTYAVEFRDGNNAASFVRVDADLPVSFTGSTTPYYAGLGADNSIWAAIYEKAFCFFRGGGTYDSINSGWSREAFNAFAFRDAGDLFVSGNGSATLNNIRDALSVGKIVTLATNDANPPADIPAVRNHVYLVERVNTTSMYIPFIGWMDVATSVVCRNPWGRDGGTSADGNTADGLVTFTADHVQRFFRRADTAWSV